MFKLFERLSSLYHLLSHSYQSLSAKLSPDGEEQDKYFSLMGTNFRRASKFKCKSAKSGTQKTC